MTSARTSSKLKPKAVGKATAVRRQPKAVGKGRQPRAVDPAKGDLVSHATIERRGRAAFRRTAIELAGRQDTRYAYQQLIKSTEDVNKIHPATRKEMADEFNMSRMDLFRIKRGPFALDERQNLIDAFASLEPDERVLVTADLYHDSKKYDSLPSWRKERSKVMDRYELKDKIYIHARNYRDLLRQIDEVRKSYEGHLILTGWGYEIVQSWGGQ